MQMYDGGGGKGWKRGVDLMFKERDFFGSSAGSQNSSKVVQPAVVPVAIDAGRKGNKLSAVMRGDGIADISSGLISEIFASSLLIFSAVYVPTTDADHLRQYVSSLVRAAVVVSMRDMRLLPPDGTPTVSVVMLMSGAFTDEDGETHWGDFCLRLVGQLIGFIIMCFALVLTNMNLFKLGVLKYSFQSTDNAQVQRLAVGFSVLTELFGTAVECIAVSRIFMPLMRVISQSSSRRGYVSRSESDPPSGGDLMFAALGIGMVHYSIERVFRATANPYVNITYAVAEAADNTFLFGVLGQFIGGCVACAYCYFLKPSAQTISRIT
jgi:glycerol uptake facilitator-like aquaporin